MYRHLPSLSPMPLSDGQRLKNLTATNLTVVLQSPNTIPLLPHSCKVPSSYWFFFSSSKCRIIIRPCRVPPRPRYTNAGGVHANTVWERITNYADLRRNGTNGSRPNYVIFAILFSSSGGDLVVEVIRPGLCRREMQ